MKKFFLAIVALLGLTCNLSAATSGEDNGFGLKLDFGFPSGSYTDYYNSSNVLDRDGISFGLIMDNRWYICPQPKWAVALDARWLDFAYSKGEFTQGNYSSDYHGVEIGVCGVGPLFTYYMNDDMAVDAYYNLVPTLNITTHESASTDPDDDYEATMLGIGCAHVLGAAFRYKFLQAGLEYRLGNINVEDVDDDLTSYDADNNMLRVFVGFKF